MPHTAPTPRASIRTTLTRLGLAAALGLATFGAAPDTASANWGSFKAEKDWSFMSFWKSKKKSHDWKDKFDWKKPKHDKPDTVSTVPELDADASGQALVLVAGGVAVALGGAARRKRKNNA